MFRRSHTNRATPPASSSPTTWTCSPPAKARRGLVTLSSWLVAMRVGRESRLLKPSERVKVTAAADHCGQRRAARNRGPTGVRTNRRVPLVGCRVCRFNILGHKLSLHLWRSGLGWWRGYDKRFPVRPKHLDLIPRLGGIA
jgi:hypothetical protein